MAAVDSLLSTTPSPSASVVTSLVLVVEGGAPRNTPPPAPPMITTAEPPCITSVEVCWMVCSVVGLVGRVVRPYPVEVMVP